MGTNTAIKLGTKAHPSTGAFDVELKENTCGVSDPVSVSLGYKSGSIKVPSGATLELNNSEEGATDVAPSGPDEREGVFLHRQCSEFCGKRPENHDHAFAEHN